MFYNILDKQRQGILPLFKLFKDDFYLAGGTALALQLGHRDSIDFDFFSPKDIDTEKLFKKIKVVFAEFKILKIQEEKNTLSVIIDDNIKLSFFTYKYPLLKELIVERYLDLASIEDIACMKLSAIVSRSTEKDYVDLYFILHKFSLVKLLDLAQKKFSELDVNLIIKSLIYFDDIVEESIKFKNDNQISLSEIKKYFQEVVINSK